MKQKMSRVAKKIVATEAANTSDISWVGTINDIKAKYSNSYSVLLSPGIVQFLNKSEQVLLLY